MENAIYTIFKELMVYEIMLDQRVLVCLLGIRYLFWNIFFLFNCSSNFNCDSLIAKIMKKNEAIKMNDVSNIL